MFGDDFMLALCMWREASGEGPEGMKAVGCVVRNRVLRNGGTSSYYREVVRPMQFSSLTAPGDPGLIRYPHVTNPVDMDGWRMCQEFAKEIMAGTIPDSTGGATYYYAVTIPLPSWAEKMTMTCQIGKHKFYKEG